MPDPFTITGTVTSSTISDRGGITVEAFDRDLPSLERRVGSAPLLGDEATADAEGRFRIKYTVEQFAAREGLPPLRRLREKNQARLLPIGPQTHSAGFGGSCDGPDRRQR